MAARSIMDTLDLCDSVGLQGESTSTIQTLGWLSPRISFSTNFIDRAAVADVKVLEECGKDEQRSRDYVGDFEFCMAASPVGPVSGKFMLHADELFDKGKLLPLYVPPRNNTEYFDRQVKTPASLSTKFCADISSPATGCVSQTGTPKSQKWREIFGVLRRARSDCGRIRPPQEDALLPPAPRSAAQQNKQPFSSNSLRLIFRRSSSRERKNDETSCRPIVRREAKVAASAASSSAVTSTACISTSTDACSYPSAHKSVYGHPLGSTAIRTADNVSRGASFGGIRDETMEDLWERSNSYNMQAGVRSKCMERDAQRKPELERSMGSNLKTTGDGRAISGHGQGTQLSNPNRLDEVVAGGTAMRTTGNNWERCSIPSGKGGKAQEPLRALRTREIRRSPERLSSYSSNVRVAPVLNVPVCIGPGMRSSKSSKGRLANLRSFLPFGKVAKLPVNASMIPTNNFRVAV